MKNLTSLFTAAVSVLLLATAQSQTSNNAQTEVVYVANNLNGMVRGYTVSGSDLGNITTTPVPAAQGIAIDASNNFYVVSTSGNHVRRFSPSGADLGIFASTGISDPRSAVFDAAGNLYVANVGTATVRRFSPTGVDLGNFISSGLSNPTGMAFDEAGNLYVANYFLGQVKKYSPNGTFLGVAISAGLSQPIGLAVIPQAQGGGFYVANDFASTVIRYNAAGAIVSTLTSGTLGRLHYLALDSAGNVYVSRILANAVRKFSPTGQDLGDFAITGLSGPAAIVIGPPPGPSCEDIVALLQAQVTELQAQLAASNNQVQALENELFDVDQFIQRLVGNFQITFKNPQFQIHGTTTSTKVNNVVTSIENLNRGMQMTVYHNLGGTK